MQTAFPLVFCLIAFEADFDSTFWISSSGSREQVIIISDSFPQFLQWQTCLNFFSTISFHLITISILKNRCWLCLIKNNLPKPQVKAPQFPLHISYFLQKCKKSKPDEMDLPYWKTISQLLNWHQNIEYIAVTCNRDSLHVRFVGICNFKRIILLQRNSYLNPVEKIEDSSIRKLSVYKLF